jgi:hypothetical protein
VIEHPPLRRAPDVLSGAFLATLLLAVPAAAAAPEVGHVVAVEGRAVASTPGQPDRVLSCDDPVHEHERVITEPGARLVIGSDAQHAHLGPASELSLGRAAGGALELALSHGAVRLLDAAAQPASRVATPAGWSRLAGADLELRRTASGALRVCDWSTGVAGCHELDAAGRVRLVVEEGPRLGLGMRSLCEWRPDHAGIPLEDFAQPAPVFAGPAGTNAFEPEPDPERPCEGDECGGFEPSDPPELDRELTVAPPPPDLPLFALP